jgi:hypothetical protein
MPKTIQQLENQLKWAKKQTAFAWAKYYEEINSSHIDDVHQYNQIQVFTEVEDIPLHIIVEFKNMMKELKKKIECPICLEIIEGDDMKLTGCGHKYCSKCYDQIDKCAICRKSIKK